MGIRVIRWRLGKPRWRVGFAWVALGAVGLSSSVVLGQRQPVDPGFADTGRAQVSFRSLPEVFRADTGFEHVYRSPDGRFYRMAGGLYAEFPRSEYVRTRGGGIRARVPAGTVFHIGAPGWVKGGEGGDGMMSRGARGDAEAVGGVRADGVVGRDVGVGRAEGAGGRMRSRIVASPLGRPIEASGAVAVAAGRARVVGGRRDVVGVGETGGADEPWVLRGGSADGAPTMSDERTRRSRLRAIAARATRRGG